MKISSNTDIEEANRIRNAIRENGGYCVCKIEKKEENRCICDEFLNQKAGPCQCGLYIKEFDNEENF